jgi:hypothetical protein
MVFAHRKGISPGPGLPNLVGVALRGHPMVAALEALNYLRRNEGWPLSATLHGWSPRSLSDDVDKLKEALTRIRIKFVRLEVGTAHRCDVSD